jgi:hypothetical protein
VASADLDFDGLGLPRLRTVHRLATAAWLGPFLCALGLFAWEALRTPPAWSHQSFIGDGAVAVLGGFALLVLCVPYAILAALVRAERRWAVIALATVAGLQWVAQFFVFLHQALVAYRLQEHGLSSGRTLTWLLLNGTYTTVLFLTAYLGTKLAVEMGASRSRPGGFTVVMTSASEGASPTKRAA